MSTNKNKKRNLNMGFNIAIDGPSGAGKSTIAKKAAERLGIIYIDTGAMYRAIGLYIYRIGADADDAAAVAENVSGANVSITYENGERQVWLNGENVSDEIRKEHIGRIASKVSAVKEVREHLLKLQKDFASQNDVIMDGRDIGTCILPNADVKIFLTASSDVRAKRRCDELNAKGQQADFEQIKKDIEERDYRDSHRELSPLRRAKDAALLDTSDMNIEQATEAVLKLIEGKR